MWRSLIWMGCALLVASQTVQSFSFGGEKTLRRRQLDIAFVTGKILEDFSLGLAPFIHFYQPLIFCVVLSS